MSDLRNDPDGTLVLMACSATKIAADKPVPLFELYDGPAWRTLRARRRSIDFDQIVVLSGGVGLRSAWSHHTAYEARISAAAVDALLERPIEDYPLAPRSKSPSGPSAYQVFHRSGMHRDGPWRQVIVAGAGEYRRAFLRLVEKAKAAGLIAFEAPVVCVEGGIGVQLGQLGRWLDQANGVGTDVAFELVDLERDEAVGRFGTLGEARKAREAAGLHAWEIRSGRLDGEDLLELRRVEICEPSDSDDDRVRQARGEWNASEIVA